MYQEATIYFNTAPNSIFKTSTGRLLYSIQRSIGSGIYSGNTNFVGNVLISDNDGVSWTLSGNTIVSPDSLNVEAGFYEQDGVITNYWRGRSGVVWNTISSNNGTTFGTASSLGLSAPNSYSNLKNYESESLILSKNLNVWDDCGGFNPRFLSLKGVSCFIRFLILSKYRYIRRMIFFWLDFMI